MVINPPPLACEVAGSHHQQGRRCHNRSYNLKWHHSPADDVPWCRAAAHDQDGDGDGDGEEAASKKGEGDDSPLAAPSHENHVPMSTSKASSIVVVFSSLPLLFFCFCVCFALFSLVQICLKTKGRRRRHFRPGCTSPYRGFITLAFLLGDGKMC